MAERRNDSERERPRRLDLVPADLSEVDLIVLCGGTSGEREVSLQSGAAIVTAFQQAAAPSRPRSLTRVEIEASGDWRADGETAAYPALEAVQRLASPSSLFFLGLHGGAGENGTLQGLLQFAGVRYTGSGVAASALCTDKHASLAVLAAAGVATCRGKTFMTRESISDSEALFGELEGESFFVKPNDGGSSVATFRVGERSGLLPAIRQAEEAGVACVLVEEEVRGVEVSCGVLAADREGGPLRTLPPVEIIPHEGRFFDYEEKYSSSGAEEVCPPRSLTAEQSLRVERDAEVAYRALGCQGYARMDFVVPAGGGAPVCLEANTLPGFTPRSLLPLEAAAVGVDFSALCVEVARLALR